MLPVLISIAKIDEYDIHDEYQVYDEYEVYEVDRNFAVYNVCVLQRMPHYL
jgi:hypothetical protein